MKKIDIKKSLLWVSIIPYMYVLLVSIYYTMFDYEGDFTVYGLQGAVDYISNLLWDILYLWDYKLGIFLLCIIYQIYYFISFQKNIKETESKMVKINLRKIFYWTSVVIWIVFLIPVIYAIIFGIEAGNIGFEHLYKGIDGLMFLFVLIEFFPVMGPILLVTLIYIIIYLIVRHREK